MKYIFIEGEPELSLLFNTLSEKERIEFLEKSIRNEKDESVRKVMQFFLSEFKRSS